MCIIRASWFFFFGNCCCCCCCFFGYMCCNQLALLFFWMLKLSPNWPVGVLLATINIKRQIPAHPKPPTCDVVKRTIYGVDVFDSTVFSCLSQNLQHLICQRLTSWAKLTWTTGKLCVDKTLWFTYLSQDSSLLKILRQQKFTDQPQNVYINI